MSKINPNINSILQSDSFKIKSADYYINGIVNDKDPLILAEAITLLESDNYEHQELTNEILIECYRKRISSHRIGITGTPGVGKSTFIESVASHLMNKNGKIAILSIDPSSTDNKGSILGDKTRMIELSQNKNVFIRPSPTRTHLGGVNEHTYEAIVMCEAAGFDLVLIETVGVGQSEHEIKNLVDCSLLLLLPGAGDDLQGIKKGISEIADIVIINKADGERLVLADIIQKDYLTAGHLSRANKANWVIPVMKYSSLENTGRQDLIKSISAYFTQINQSGFYSENRLDQQQYWLRKRINQYCANRIGDAIIKSNKLQSDIKAVLAPNASPFESFLDIKSKLHIDLDYT